MKDPKEVPAAASEVIGAPRFNQTPEKIIENHLPDSQSSGDSQSNAGSKSSLPFSAAQLRAALPKKEDLKQKEVRKEPIQEEPAISYDDIKAFEDAITEVEPSYVVEDSGSNSSSNSSISHGSSVSTKKSVSINRPAMNDGFFSNFQEFMKDPNALDETILDGDLVHKMRLFHERRNDGKEPFVHQKDASEAIKRKLHELQMLEHEWHTKYTEMKHAERSLINLEEELDQKTQNLKQLLKTTKQLSMVGQKVDDSQGFRLSDGSILTSITALRRAVARMDSLTYSNHVDVRTNRNDFAQWVLDVFKNQALAKAIAETNTKDELLQILTKFGYE